MEKATQMSEESLQALIRSATIEYDRTAAWNYSECQRQIDFLAKQLDSHDRGIEQREAVHVTSRRLQQRKTRYAELFGYYNSQTYKNLQVLSWRVNSWDNASTIHSMCEEFMQEFGRILDDRKEVLRWSVELNGKAWV